MNSADQVETAPIGSNCLKSKKITNFMAFLQFQERMTSSLLWY